MTDPHPLAAAPTKPIAPKANPIVRAIVDYGGVVVFIAAYFLFGRDLIKASWGLMAGSVVSLLIGLVFERRVAPVPLFTALAALIFGGLALFFHDPRFVQIKPTALNLVLGAVMLGGAATRRNPLKALLNDAIHMDDAHWRTLTVRYGLLFIVQAAVNEVFWRTQPDAIWITFHMPVLLAMSLIFSFTQAPFLMKHMHDTDAHPEGDSGPNSAT
jgi:intracellular septation protein